MTYGMEGSGLQAACAAASAAVGPQPVPHHPICCRPEEPLFLFEDGSMACPHVTVGAGDGRTQAAVNHSVALLLMEGVLKL